MTGKDEEEKGFGIATTIALILALWAGYFIGEIYILAAISLVILFVAILNKKKAD